jgi:hypothetical protein
MFGENESEGRNEPERCHDEATTFPHHRLGLFLLTAILILFITFREYSLFTDWPGSIKKFTMNYAVTLKKTSSHWTELALLYWVWVRF